MLKQSPTEAQVELPPPCQLGPPFQNGLFKNSGGLGSSRKYQRVQLLSVFGTKVLMSNASRAFFARLRLEVGPPHTFWKSPPGSSLPPNHLMVLTLGLQDDDPPTPQLQMPQEGGMGNWEEGRKGGTFSSWLDKGSLSGVPGDTHPCPSSPLASGGCSH